MVRLSPGRICVVSPKVTGAPVRSAKASALAPATTAASVVPNRAAIASRLSEVAGSELLAAATV